MTSCEEWTITELEEEFVLFLFEEIGGKTLLAVESDDIDSI